jgi:16S rRNA (cytidine1402-2'-O)-methyltransferase
MNKGTLFVVGAPIGNLSDVTFRAVETLKTVDLIACEDTRVSKKLLDHFDIKTPTVSYFQHSKLSKIVYIIEQLNEGKSIALITDAGTPGISDPGQHLVASIQKTDNRIQIIPIPGPSALASAASVSGMIEKELCFVGFLPKKKGRQTKFKELSKIDAPIVIYESAMRLPRTLRDIKTYLGDNTEVFIAREMTKMFEEYWGGNVKEMIDNISDHQLKGEIVLIIKKVR